MGCLDLPSTSRKATNYNDLALHRQL
jgi:hypothetical protein